MLELEVNEESSEPSELKFMEGGAQRENLTSAWACEIFGLGLEEPHRHDAYTRLNTAPKKGFLSYPPCPCAILFVIARALVHDVKSILTPSWHSLVIQPYCSFRYGRECAKSGSSGKLKGEYLLSGNIIRQLGLFGLKEISRHFDNHFVLVRHWHGGCCRLWGEL
jgi:hypothetical protein